MHNDLAEERNDALNALRRLLCAVDCIRRDTSLGGVWETRTDRDALPGALAEGRAVEARLAMADAIRESEKAEDDDNE